MPQVNTTSISGKDLLERLRTKSPEHYQKLVRLYTERNEAIESNLSQTYVPNGKAEEFIKIVGAGKTFVSMFVAANGVGKSAAGANIVTNIIFSPQSKWFQYPLFQKWPYEKRGRIISDPTTLKEKIIPELRKWFPVNEVKNIPDANFEELKEGKGYTRKITTNTGWTIDLMSTEQDTKEFESVDLSFCWIDEPMPKDRFMATLARGRMGMVVFWTFTPLTYSAWIKDWMDERSADAGYLNYVEAELEDQCVDHGVRGILKHENIKRISDGFPEDEREARVFGKFGHLIGRVHKGFKRSIHVIKPFPIDERRFTTYKALDPHPRVADHVLYMSVDSKGTKFITGEIISEGLVKELHSRMVAFEAAMNYRMQGRIIDPAAFNDDQHRKENSVAIQLLNLGEHYIGGSKDLQAGIKRTNDALSYQEVNGRMVKPPELYIFDTCPVAIKQLDEYVWSEWKGPSKDDKQPRGKPKDVNDHQVENLHRLLLSEPIFTHYVQVLNQREMPGGSGNAMTSGPYDYHDSDNLDPYDR